MGEDGADQPREAVEAGAAEVGGQGGGPGLLARQRDVENSEPRQHALHVTGRKKDLECLYLMIVLYSHTCSNVFDLEV